MPNNATWTSPNAVQRLAIISAARSVAILGMSNKVSRASYFVATYLQSCSNYSLYFVNPVLAQAGVKVLGQQVYSSLADLPQAPDIVDIFRKNEDLPQVVEQTIACGASTAWMQLGCYNLEAAQLGQQAGINVVMDRCLKIEHARFHGGLHLAGFNTGVISSQRQRL